MTSSLVQALSYIDNLLPGTELEIHTTTSAEAVALRPMIKNVRVLTLPYLEFEFCNVYRGTQGKTLPLIHRHPDAVVLLRSKGDHADLERSGAKLLMFYTRATLFGIGQKLDFAIFYFKHVSCRIAFA